MMSWSKYSFQFICQVFLLKLYYSCQLKEARLAKAIKLIMTISYIEFYFKNQTVFNFLYKLVWKSVDGVVLLFLQN